MTQATDDVVRRNIKRELPCKLTEEEFTRIARQRATKEAERDELMDDLAKEKKRRQDQIEELNDEIGKMGTELRTGNQDRTVPCNEVFRRAADGTGWIHTIRLDTFDEVERRPATAHETQRYLPNVEPGNISSGSVLDDARAQQAAAAQRSAGGDDVPSEDDAPIDDDASVIPDDAPEAGEEDASDGAPAKKPKPEKFDQALLAEGKCALRFEGGDGCALELGHAGLHKSASHSWKARRPKPEQAASSSPEATA